jgi:hypothetical protein
VPRLESATPESTISAPIGSLRDTPGTPEMGAVHVP